jgi:polysaccharide export outer membrane protein
MAMLSLAVFFLAGCTAGGGDDTQHLPPSLAQASAYKLSPGDEVQVRVFDHPDISGTYEVGSKGGLMLPLLNRVPAQGLTVEELRDRIEKGLNATYLVNARVSVELLNYRPVYVLGEVRSPGSYAYQPGLTVYHVIAKAGGYTRRAATDTVTLVRPGRNGPTRYEVPKWAPIRPGDMIEVDRRLF